MDCRLGYVHLCSVQRKFEEFFTAVSLLSQPCPHDHCHHTQVVLAESLPLLHMRESPHLGVLSCSLHYRISQWFCDNQDLWWNQQEMKYAVGPFRSQHVAHVWPYLLSRQIRIGNVSAFSCVRKPQSKATIGVVLSRSSSSNSSIRCCPPTPRPSGFIRFILTLGISASPRVPHLLRFPFRHLHDILLLVRCHHQLVLHLDSEFSMDFTSALLCHLRFPTADSSSQDNDPPYSPCWSLSISLLDFIRNWKCCFSR